MKVSPIICVVPTGDICGEAATWSARGNSVYWVDINRFLIHCLNLEDKSVRSFHFDEPVVALSLTDVEGQFLVALGSKLILWNSDTDSRLGLDVTLPGIPEVRFNDGRSDPLGDFWIGSMSNNVGPNGENLDIVSGLGKLYRYRYGGELEEIEDRIGISNTLCWNIEKTIFYFGDTLKNEIRAYDYDSKTGSISNGRSFLTGFERGLPDGSSIDIDGYLWNCRYGGACVVRVAPNGEIDCVIEMPVKNITNCVFGGADASILFVTTASAQKDKKDRLAGSLFSIQTDNAGLPENKFITSF
jgi:sugar lactone lactonase YvrE